METATKNCMPGPGEELSVLNLCNAFWCKVRRNDVCDGTAGVVSFPRRSLCGISHQVITDLLEMQKDTQFSFQEKTHLEYILPQTRKTQ